MNPPSDYASARQSHLVAVIRFLCVGLTSTVIHLTFQHVLIDYLGVQPQLGYMVAFLGTFTWSWPAHHYLTFRNPQSAKSTMAGWLLRSTLLQIATLACFSLGIHLMGVTYHLLSTVMSAAIVQTCGYVVAHRHFTPHHPPTDDDLPSALASNQIA